MNRNIKHIMRTVLVLLLFQFISPTFFSVVTLGSASEDVKTSFAPIHSSIIVPVFLKEKEEREHEETVDKSFDLIPVVDFFHHSLTHTASQSLILKGYNHQDKFGCQPPLFELYRTFLI
jgi:hypothetical protein